MINIKPLGPLDLIEHFEYDSGIQETYITIYTEDGAEILTIMYDSKTDETKCISSSGLSTDNWEEDAECYARALLYKRQISMLKDQEI